MLNVYHPILALNQEAHTTGVLLTIDHPIEYIVRLALQLHLCESEGR